jgi:RNA polymerase sigma-70 factor, ECF subfamily
MYSTPEGTKRIIPSQCQVSLRERASSGGSADPAPLEHLPDDELVARFLNGDRAAMSAIFQRWNKRATAFAHLHLREQEQVHDVVQNAWVKVLRGVYQFRGTAKFSTWLFTVVLNECRAMRGRAREKQMISIDAGLPQDAWESMMSVSRVDVEHQDQQDRDLLHRQIQCLPAVYKRILLMHYVQGVPLSKVADRLKISRTDAKSRIVRARAELRARILRPRRRVSTQAAEFSRA